MSGHESSNWYDYETEEPSNGSVFGMRAMIVLGVGAVVPFTYFVITHLGA
ncbi:hypothetical protein MPEAHAMD_7200 [Methylobacterium frigidaeris]|uniref:Uncharacterized protein n=1 Tax=Methylobacterium frigidaeris TaxID=2038277 RepID=A0AA37M978_9HYPH|nr:hypothetical protein MPEAHAMD_7200 [Methylobacterium frigidaeris]